MKRNVLFLIILTAAFSVSFNFAFAATPVQIFKKIFEAIGISSPAKTPPANVSSGNQNEKPAVDIRADNVNGPLTVPQGEEAMISWFVRNPETNQAVLSEDKSVTCAASSSHNDFTGKKPSAGSQNVKITSGPRTYTMSCKLPNGGEAEDTVTINAAPDEIIWFQNIYGAPGWTTWQLNNLPFEKPEFSQDSAGEVTLIREISAGFEFSQTPFYTDIPIQTSLDDILIDKKIVRILNGFGTPFYDTVSIPVSGLLPGKHRVSSQLTAPLTRYELKKGTNTNNYSGYKGRIFAVSEFEILPAETQKPEVDLRVNGADSVEIPAGSQATLTWTSSGVDTCTSQVDGKDLAIDLPLQEVIGRETAPVDANHAFTIVCVNSITEQQASDSIKIKAIK